MAKSSKKSKNKKSHKPKTEKKSNNKEKITETQKTDYIPNPKLVLSYKDAIKEVKNANGMQKAKAEPAKNIEAPAKKAAEAPEKKSKATAQNAEEPVKNIEAPAKKTAEAPEKKSKATAQNAEEPAKNIEAPVKTTEEEPAKKLKEPKQKIKVTADILITDGDYTEVLETDEDSAENNEKGIFSRFFKQVK